MAYPGDTGDQGFASDSEEEEDAVKFIIEENDRLHGCHLFRVESILQPTVLFVDKIFKSKFPSVKDEFTSEKS